MLTLPSTNILTQTKYPPPPKKKKLNKYGRGTKNNVQTDTIRPVVFHIQCPHTAV